MNFRIATTFSDSLIKLTNDEQKAVKTTAFDLQMNPANPGLQFHKIESARDPNFWSVRVSRDIRLIVHKTESNLLLCYVGHHDEAYNWAERRKLETHPQTGAAQLVEIRETIREIEIPRYVKAETPAPEKPLLFADIPDWQLLSYGVPQEWMEDVRNATEDTVLELADHLPQEAAEALLDIATGAIPEAERESYFPSEAPLPQDSRMGFLREQDPFEHPDARRRFRIMANSEELARALEYPWEKWTIFLHPVQRRLVEKDYNGPARISGSAGTGKTIVALHRAVFLARNNSDARILLTTFSETLANALRIKLRRLISNEPRIAEQIEVHAINAIGQRLYELNIGKLRLASKEKIRRPLESAAGEQPENKFSLHFLWNEWEQVLDAWQLNSWDAYRDVLRLGRKTRLPEKQRERLWSIFERVRSELYSMDLITESRMFSRLASLIADKKLRPFDFAVVDEAQDISVAQLRFLAALGGNESNRLFFTGDLGQRIFQQPFSWKALGIEIKGRSATLRINYRTSHQIRMQADKLLGPELSDVDGFTEDRRGTISVFNGPQPVIKVVEEESAEIHTVAQWLQERIADGILPHEIGIFVRSSDEIGRAQKTVEEAKLSYMLLDEDLDLVSGSVSIGTMHLAKGLEFRAVAVMACDDEVIPSQTRIETVIDDSDLEEVYNTERHLLYVACTRARDHLLVTGVKPGSEFLDDFKI